MAASLVHEALEAARDVEEDLLHELPVAEHSMADVIKRMTATHHSEEMPQGSWSQDVLGGLEEESEIQDPTLLNYQVGSPRPSWLRPQPEELRISREHKTKLMLRGAYKGSLAWKGRAATKLEVERRQQEAEAAAARLKARSKISWISARNKAQKDGQEIHHVQDAVALLAATGMQAKMLVREGSAKVVEAEHAVSALLSRRTAHAR